MSFPYSTSAMARNETSTEFVTYYLNTTSTVTNQVDLSSGTSISYMHRIICSAMLLFVFILGLSGNGLVMLSVLLSKKLQTPTNVLVVSLAMADFLACVVFPLQICMLLSQSDWPFPEIVCKVVVYISYVALGCSVMTLAAIAIIRWYVITRSVYGNHGINTHRSMILVAIIIWMASTFAIVTPPSLGVGSVGYSDFYRLCSVTDDNPLRAYYVLIHALMLFLALSVTAIFYILILLFVLRSTKSFRAQFKEDETSQKDRAGDANGKSVASKFNKREIEITKNLFVVVCVFVLCISPQVANFVIPGASTLTLYTGILMASNSSLNPVIYGLKHPNFREVFRCLLTCNPSAIPQTTVMVKNTSKPIATVSNKINNSSVKPTKST